MVHPQFILLSFITIIIPKQIHKLSFLILLVETDLSDKSDNRLRATVSGNCPYGENLCIQKMKGKGSDITHDIDIMGVDRAGMGLPIGGRDLPINGGTIGFWTGLGNIFMVSVMRFVHPCSIDHQAVPSNKSVAVQQDNCLWQVVLLDFVFLPLSIFHFRVCGNDKWRSHIVCP